MFSKAMAEMCRDMVIPERYPAVITLNPGNSTITETLTAQGCWIKPISGKLQKYGDMYVQGDQTLIKVPDDQLNPTNNGRQIRTGDSIVFRGSTYNVTQAGTTVKSVLTTWECVCKLVIQ